MTVVATTDRPKSVLNRCVIERFVASSCYFDFALSVVKGACHDACIYIGSI